MSAKREKHLPVVKCYDVVNDLTDGCHKKTCRQWINHPRGKNCIVATTRGGALTLNDVGEIYGLTRMRICQIERSIFEKLRETFDPITSCDAREVP